jgi:hypothetical protein
MKNLLILALLITSVKCYSQDTSKVDISGRSVDISGRRDADASNGAGDYLDKYARISSTGLWFNIWGTGAMIAGFAIPIKTLHQANIQRWVIVSGAGLNLIGLIIQASAVNSINNAAYKLRSKKIAMLINENGIGFQFAIK